MRLLLLATAFVTLYLAIFLILSFRHDDIVVIRDRVRRYENEFFIAYKKMGDAKNPAYLAEQKPLLEKRILRSLGKKGEKHAAEFKSIFENCWQEMLSAFGERTVSLSAGANPVQSINAVELKEIVRSSLEDILKIENGKWKTENVGEEAAPAEEIDPVEKVAPTDEIESVEEIDEIEEVAPAEEIESVEETDDVESLEEIESLEEAEEVSEIDDDALPHVANDVSDDDVLPIEEIEALEEIEEVAPAEEIEPVDGADDVESLEEIEALEEAEELDEIEEVTPAEEIEPADTGALAQNLKEESENADDDIYKDEILLEKIEFGVPTSENLSFESDDSVVENFVVTPLDFSFLDEEDSDEKLYENVDEVEPVEDEIAIAESELIPDEDAELIENLEENPFENEENLQESGKNAEILEELPSQESDELQEEQTADLEDAVEVEALEDSEENMPFMFTKFAASQNTSVAELVPDAQDAIVQDLDGTFRITELSSSDVMLELDHDFKKLVDSILR